jgi:hypothetical protein
MAYRYHDGSEVKKNLLKKESSMFIVAAGEMRDYGATVVFWRDDGDDWPLVTVLRPGKEPKKMYMTYDSLIYIGELNEND